MVKVIILLYSREAVANAVRVVQGHSGKTYGHAAPNHRAGRLECRMPLEDYLVAAEDISANTHRSYCKWVVVPEVEEILEGREKDLADQVELLKAQLSEALLNASVESVSLSVSPLEALPAVISEPDDVAPEFKGKTFRELRALAKRAELPGWESFTRSSDIIAALTDNAKAVAA